MPAEYCVSMSHSPAPATSGLAGPTWDDHDRNLGETVAAASSGAKVGDDPGHVTFGEMLMLVADPVWAAGAVRGSRSPAGCTCTGSRPARSRSSTARKPRRRGASRFALVRPSTAPTAARLAGTWAAAVLANTVRPCSAVRLDRRVERGGSRAGGAARGDEQSVGRDHDTLESRALEVGRYGPSLRAAWRGSLALNWAGVSTPPARMPFSSAALFCRFSATAMRSGVDAAARPRPCRCYQLLGLGAGCPPRRDRRTGGACVRREHGRGHHGRRRDRGGCTRCESSRVCPPPDVCVSTWVVWRWQRDRRGRWTRRVLPERGHVGNVKREFRRVDYDVPRSNGCASAAG